MTNEQAMAMLEWVGLMVPREEDIDSILWHVAERLEREGWRFYGWDFGYIVHTKAGGLLEGPSPGFPTKADAVIAAWKRATGATP